MRRAAPRRVQQRGHNGVRGGIGPCTRSKTKSPSTGPSHQSNIRSQRPVTAARPAQIITANPIVAMVATRSDAPLANRALMRCAEINERVILICPSIHRAPAARPVL